MRAIHAFVYGILFPSFREPVPLDEALDALCCWLDICGSRLSCACLLLLAPPLVVAAIYIAHANWLHVTPFAAGPSH
jgi:hypothetical protein